MVNVNELGTKATLVILYIYIVTNLISRLFL